MCIFLKGRVGLLGEEVSNLGHRLGVGGVVRCSFSSSGVVSVLGRTGCISLFGRGGLVVMSGFSFGGIGSMCRGRLLECVSGVGSGIVVLGYVSRDLSREGGVAGGLERGYGMRRVGGVSCGRLRRCVAGVFISGGGGVACGRMGRVLGEYRCGSSLTVGRARGLLLCGLNRSMVASSSVSGIMDGDSRGRVFALDSTMVGGGLGRVFGSCGVLVEDKVRPIMLVSGLTERFEALCRIGVLYGAVSRGRVSEGLKLGPCMIGGTRRGMGGCRRRRLVGGLCRLDGLSVSVGMGNLSGCGILRGFFLGVWYVCFASSAWGVVGCDVVCHVVVGERIVWYWFLRGMC